jgi:iron(III) transport system permease protein
MRSYKKPLLAWLAVGWLGIGFDTHLATMPFFICLGFLSLSFFLNKSQKLFSWGLLACSCGGVLALGYEGFVSLHNFGLGAFLVLSSFIYCFAQGLSARGAIRGETFIVSVITFVMSLVLLFVFFPVCQILQHAFFDSRGLFSPGNFFDIFTRSSIWGLQCVTHNTPCGAAINSVFLAMMTGIGSTVLGLSFALIMTRTGFKAKKLLRVSSLLPIITPPFVIGLAVILLFGRSGAVTSFLEWAFAMPPSRWIYGFWGIWLAQLLAFTPIAFMVLIGVVEGISPSMEEAAQTLGASRWKTFWSVSFPLMRPGIANAFLLGFIESFADFGNPLVLGGNYDVLATEIYFAIAGAQSDQAQAAILAIVLLCFSLTAFYVQRQWVGKRSYATMSGKGDSGVHATLPKGLSVGIFTLILPWVFLTLVIYSMILFGGFVEIWGLDHSFTLRHFSSAFSIEYSEHGILWRGAAWHSFWTTLKIAALSAPFTALIGLLIAYILARQRFAGLAIFEFITLLTFAIPGTVIGVSYILSFNVAPIEITGTGIILIICFLFRNMPVSIRSGVANLSQIDKSLDESSLTLRAGTFTTLRRVILPLLKPAVVSSLVYGFVRAMTSLSAVIFLVSANYDLSTTYIVGLVENGDYGIAIAYSSVLIIVMLITILVIQKWIGERNIGRRKAHS